jgi:hypothetical protein
MRKLLLVLSALLVADVLAPFSFAGVGAFHPEPRGVPPARGEARRRLAAFSATPGFLALSVQRRHHRGDHNG